MEVWLSGNDLVLLSVVFIFLSSVLLGKGFMLKKDDEILIENATYLGHNPFSIKNSIIEKVMTQMSLFINLLVTLFSILGLYMNINGIGHGSLFMGSMDSLAIFLIFAIILLFTVCKFSDYLASRAYMPTLKELMQEVYQKALYTYRNDGSQLHLTNSSIELSRGQRDKYMAEARDRLKRLALLFDLRLKKKYDYDDIAKQLEVYFT